MRKANKIINRICVATVLSIWCFTGISIIYLLTGHGVKESLLEALPIAFWILLLFSIIAIFIIGEKK